MTETNSLADDSDPSDPRQRPGWTDQKHSPHVYESIIPGLAMKCRHCEFGFLHGIHTRPLNDECISCPEGMPVNECPKSQRPCGHHCNHSWDQDHCHWCETEFGEEGEESTEKDSL